MIWKKKQAESLDKDLIAKYKLSPIQAKLFAIRGINTDQQLDFWLNADETKLADPFLMHDMKKQSIELIRLSIRVKKLQYMAIMMLMVLLRQVLWSKL